MNERKKADNKKSPVPVSSPSEQRIGQKVSTEEDKD